jgi:ABC-2 type transport system permease protein
MFVVALREYNAAVRTKAFLISLLIMPIMLGGSILIQWILKDVKDTKDKHFAVVNRTGRATLLDRLQAKVKEYNENKTIDERTQKQVRPRFVLEEVPPPDENKVNALRVELSDRVRSGELFGFLEIGPRVFTPKPSPSPDAAHPDPKEEEYVLRYQSNRPTYFEFPQFVDRAITQIVQEERGGEAGVEPKTVRAIVEPVPLESKGLSKLNAQGGIDEATEAVQLAPFLVPFGLLMLMFMVIMMSATPLMQGVVEEKMQRIAEVLLGSVRPFDLMMGKLLGMSAVSLTITAVYLGGAYWAAFQYKFSEYISGELLMWFFVFQALAALMYGSLFIAIGAACTDMKETQNLLWPVMLLATLPMFVVGSVLQEPSSPVATGLSFFPFATPMLMIARQAVPPGIPLWQPLLGVVLVMATTLACVYAAGRIFRVGLLMQGKGARLGEMVQWVIRG